MLNIQLDRENSRALACVQESLICSPNRQFHCPCLRKVDRFLEDGNEQNQGKLDLPHSKLVQRLDLENRHLDHKHYHFESHMDHEHIFVQQSQLENRVESHLIQTFLCLLN